MNADDGRTPEEKKGTGPICRNGPEAGTDAQRWSAHKLDLSPSSLRPPHDRIYQLLSAEADGWLAPDERQELLNLLRNDPQARAAYAEQAILHSLLFHKARGGDGRGVGNLGFGDLEIWRFGDLPQDVGAAVGLPPHPESRVPSPESPLHFHPLSPLPSPLSPPFVGGPVFSYMVATVILGVMLLGAWAYTITHYRQAVHNSSPVRPFGVRTPEIVFVGRVTGMKDCRWADPTTQTYTGASVPLGRQYALSAGLMEITYSTGATVILEGPCTYQVESRTGGYLALGKLTAKVRKREGLAASAASGKLAAAAKPQAANPKSLNLQISKFVVRTPTAIVTDLGTEFGVEVSENGDTTSHVFRGSIKVQAAKGLAASAASGADSADGNPPREAILQENESVRVGRVRETHHDPADGEPVRFTHPTTLPQFVRRLIEPPKALDLLDIVAGGYGTGHRRERGIDPTTGMQDVVFPVAVRSSGGQYHPVSWNTFIAGVFVPDGRHGAVLVDSAGHAFDGFPRTSGNGYGSIWARAATVEAERMEEAKGPWVYTMGPGEQFTPKRGGLLCLCPNAGVVFSLEAMRRTYREAAPSRFRAVAGMIDNRARVPAADGLADVWIFVDGHLKFKREQLRPQNGAICVDIELSPADRFLTLVSTDGGNGYENDYVVFGDPVLEMTPTEENE